MTPTQAQIDAAAKAIRAVLHKDHRGAKGAEALAKAALTAAAEVPEEVDPQEWLNKVKFFEAADKHLKNATIERCAQVAEKAGMGEDVSVARASIAAAIRAIKKAPSIGAEGS